MSEDKTRLAMLAIIIVLVTWAMIRPSSQPDQRSEPATPLEWKGGQTTVAPPAMPGEVLVVHAHRPWLLAEAESDGALPRAFFDFSPSEWQTLTNFHSSRLSSSNSLKLVTVEMISLATSEWSRVSYPALVRSNVVWIHK